MTVVSQPDKPEYHDFSLESLRLIDYVKYKWLVQLLKYFPWLLFAYVFVNFFFVNSLFRSNISNIILGSNPIFEESALFVDNMQLSGLLASGIGFLALATLLQKASSLLNDLWLRGVFLENSRDMLVEFSTTIEKLANHWGGQLGICLFFIAIIAFSSAFRCVNNSPSNIIDLFGCNATTSGFRLSKAVLEAITALLLGLLIWRMLVVAWAISELGEKFEFNLIWNHPDKSGGLLPVGVVCFWLAAIVAIPAIFLGMWLIHCGTNNCNQFSAIQIRLVVFENVLLIVIILSLLSFVWPLWSVHKAMVIQRIEFQNTTLSSISQEIDLTSNNVVTNVGKIAHLKGSGMKNILEENELLNEKLILLQKTYDELDKMPVWPFNKNTVLKLATSQSIPLLGLTGIGAEIINFLNGILNSFSPSS